MVSFRSGLKGKEVVDRLQLCACVCLKAGTNQWQPFCERQTRDTSKQASSKQQAM